MPLGGSRVSFGVGPGGLGKRALVVSTAGRPGFMPAEVMSGRQKINASKRSAALLAAWQDICSSRKSCDRTQRNTVRRKDELLNIYCCGGPLDPNTDPGFRARPLIATSTHNVQKHQDH